jgi:hypothetical protein
MSLTNFPHGISSFGVPVVGAGGIMTQGNCYFVNPRTGSDGNDGKSPESAKATLAAAYNLCTENQNDVVYLLSSSNTSASTTCYLSSALTWSKSLTHLVGVSSPTMIGKRARIAQTSTATGVTGLITLSGNSCIFANLTIWQGVDDATSYNALEVTGDRNYFYNVNVQGLGSDTQRGTASVYGMRLNGAEENTFEKCVIGLDTIAGGAAELDIAGDSRDNIFKECIFLKCAGAAGNLMVAIEDDGLLGFTLFDRCMFINTPTAAGAVTTMTTAFTNTKALTDFDGVVVLYMPIMVGITDLGTGGAYYGLGIGASDQTATDLGLSEALS